MQQKKLKEIKRGEFVKKIINGKPSQKIYIKGNYDRASKSYILINYFDINDEIFIKANKSVFVGVEF